MQHPVSTFPPPPPSCVVGYPLPPHVQLLNYIREKSRLHTMNNMAFQFAGEISMEFRCAICMLVPNEPRRVTCCSRFFCLQCIGQWLNAQNQCPVCFRPNIRHVNDPSLTERIARLPIFCRYRMKGCGWHGQLKDLQAHQTGEDGCPFFPVDCPLSEYGCVGQSILRRDVIQHMTENQIKHLNLVFDKLKDTTSGLESQTKKMDELQQRFSLFSSQFNSAVQARSNLESRTDLLQLELQKMKLKVLQLEERLHHRFLPPSLSNLETALSETFPRLCDFPGEEEEPEDGTEIPLNEYLIRDLMEIERARQVRGVATAVYANEGGVVFQRLPARHQEMYEGGHRVNHQGGVVMDGTHQVGVIMGGYDNERSVVCEEANLPVGGALPTETAGLPLATATEEWEEKDVCETSSVTPLSHTFYHEERHGDLNFGLENKEPSPPVIMPTYATAVSKPFHPVLRNLGSTSKPQGVMQQSAMTAIPQTTTVTVTNHITSPAVVAVDAKNSNQGCGGMFVGQTDLTAASVTETTNRATGQQGRLSQDTELTVQSVDEAGYGVVPSPHCGRVGWGTSPEWATGRGGCRTPRSCSSLSLHSNSSTDTSFTGDTVIQYGSSTVLVSTTSGKKSPSPDPTQVKLFVKYMPHSCSPEKAVSLFLTYGKVHLLEYHSEHKDKLFLIMDREGGLRAMSALNGTRLAGSPKPLSVQLYRSVPVCTTPIVQRAESVTSDKTIRLFVKNLGSDMTVNDITGLFGVYGQVFDVQKHPNRRNVAFIYMCHEGGKKAISCLNGFQSQKMNRPLIVELSHEPPTMGATVKV